MNFTKGALGALLTLYAVASLAGVAELKSGVVVEGRMGKASTLGGDPLSIGQEGDVEVKKIVFVDDDLRRTYFSTNMVANLAESEPGGQERIRIGQRVAIPTSGRQRIANVGSILRITPFDEFGRRICTMMTPRGKVDIIQGITEISPRYTKVEGLLSKNPYVWDTRIATSTIPRETLSKVLMNQIDPKNPDDRLRVFRFYLQSERYRDAGAELESLLEDFPELSEYERQLGALQQLGARRVLSEIELRRQAGQHRLAISWLSNFPSKDVAAETLLRVRDMLNDYKELRQRGQRAVDSLKSHLEQVSSAQRKARFEPICKEIENELNIHTIDRLADYLRFAEVDNLSADQKVALAVSGWLMGSGAGSENAAVAGSLGDVRRLVRAYLTTQVAHERQQALEELASLEGATPDFIAKIIAHMKPPSAPEEPAEDGFYQRTVALPMAEDGDMNYWIQLPPEYDPHRRYPCVITLHGAATSPQNQIDWWAGGWDKDHRLRMGQAARHGYIVIAPAWAKEHQSECEYSFREHAAVLFSLRDACRQFSIDTDRVFLSGHSMGGDSAWDIGLAHPDLFAGVLPIVAEADKYVSRYWENARHNLPMYFVCGEMDGGKMAANSREFDRYLGKHGYDVMVVEYLGRGHEHFIDDIQRIFKWMEAPAHRRNLFPEEFRCLSMRRWDNFFYWAEMDQFPQRSLVDPISWPPSRGVRPAITEGRVLENNRVILKTAADQATVWLSPEMVDFSQRVTVSINGRGRASGVTPSIETMLEDVRTRADRLHPFWAKVESDRR